MPRDGDPKLWQSQRGLLDEAEYPYIPSIPKAGQGPQPWDQISEWASTATNGQGRHDVGPEHGGIITIGPSFQESVVCRVNGRTHVRCQWLVLSTGLGQWEPGRLQGCAWRTGTWKAA